jgi:hypothetical protein
MTGMGNLSLMVNLLRAQKSGHMRHKPSFFKTITTGDEYGLGTWANDPCLQQFLYYFFYFIFLSKWIHVWAYIGGLTAWKERDVVIMLTLRRGVILLASQRPYGACPRPVADQDGLLGDDGSLTWITLS